MESTHEAHIARVKHRFDEGRSVLSSLNSSDILQTFDIPDIAGRTDDILNHPPSLPEDWQVKVFKHNRIL